MTFAPCLRKRLAAHALFLTLLGPVALAARDITSGDAYARFDPQTSTWTIGTATVEEQLQFQNRQFTLVNFRNKMRPHRVIARPCEEFRLTSEGVTYASADPKDKWEWLGGEASVLPQGEIQLVVRLKSGVLITAAPLATPGSLMVTTNTLRVEKTYVVYPGTSIIRQWTRFTNAGSHLLTLTDPSFLTFRTRIDDSSHFALNYLTGGGAFTGSQILKEVPFSTSYARTFDSTDTPEQTTVAGQNYGGPLKFGSGIYMPWFAVRDGDSGVFVGFDYYGRWAAEIGNFYGAPGYLGLRLSGFNKTLAPGESIETPKAFTAVFAGDLDSMGNQLKAWQYRYLWDFTSDRYFAKPRLAIQLRNRPRSPDSYYGGGTQDNWDYRLAELFRMVDVLRYTGADILWQDAGWYDILGDNDGPDFASAKGYLAKYGADLAIWWPLYYVQKESKVFQQHPGWLSDPSKTRSHLDMSQRGVMEYLRLQLNAKVAVWGDFQWRMDGETVWPVRDDQTPMLEQYHNAMGLLADFRRGHPGSSIDLCSGGGNLMGYESLRMSDVSQLTDGGGALQIGNYYSSYLFPPDKIDDWTHDSTFSMEAARSSLTMAAAWIGDQGVVDPEPGLWMNNGLENLRHNFEIYRYLVTQGVAGRWAQVYHPRVEGDDPIYYFQRLSRDGKRGVVILKHFTSGQAKVYPKGLAAQSLYDVRFEISKRAESRTGADLMMKGIALTAPAPGELVYLGLPNHPGSGLDRTPPSVPGNVQKTIAVNLGVTGVAIKWQASKDNNWLSYYQIYRDGEALDKVAKGTYYFDHTGGAANISASYQVQAVDGDGNASRRVEAQPIKGEKITFTAWGGFLSGKDYSYQGANGWRYEEWSGEKHTPMSWNGARGKMGFYEGTTGATIGASWMRPGNSASAVRAFSLPYSGRVTVSATIHKDIHHNAGDGVRVKLLMGSQQLWPQSGWQAISAGDVTGTHMEVHAPVQRGEELFFVADPNTGPEDDDTVWNPQITYDQLMETPWRLKRTLIDDASSRVKFSGHGWQELGVGPTREQGYLPGRLNGTLALSGTAGDKVALKFQGTGVEILGDAALNRGIASVMLDGHDMGTIDTFLPEDSQQRPQLDATLLPREPTLWSTLPSKCLWGIEDLPNGEHTIELLVTGRKNRESQATFVAIDGFVVFSPR